MSPPKQVPRRIECACCGVGPLYVSVIHRVACAHRETSLSTRPDEPRHELLYRIQKPRLLLATDRQFESMAMMEPGGETLGRIGECIATTASASRVETNFQMPAIAIAASTAACGTRRFASCRNCLQLNHRAHSALPKSTSNLNVEVRRCLGPFELDLDPVPETPRSNTALTSIRLWPIAMTPADD